MLASLGANARGYMFTIEHRKGSQLLERSTTHADNLDAAIASAQERAKTLGADNIRVSSAAGKEIGVFPVRSESLR
jgi:hypothetical protein